MSEGAHSPQPLYTVTSQHHTTRVDEAGNVAEGVEVSFHVPHSNSHGKVFIHGNPPDVAAAQEALREAAEAHVAIHQLSD